ncbi:MAG: hypothetical protein HY860_02610 [Chlamydiales bacterium]|nr:hypothetical protein [Chlamydiales bacterium]
MIYDEVVYELVSLKNKPEIGRLEHVKQVMRILSSSFDYPMIHVAGTNGKGSTCCKLQHIYKLSGYKTGCYTSPHLFTIRERIQINEAVIPKEDFVRLYQYITGVFDRHEIPRAYFDILTLMGFLYFQEKQVDIAIIEVGLGGRLDATNVITPILSIITSIQQDHMHILGNTLDQISEEKAGIIKKNIPALLAPSAQRAPVFKKAFYEKAPVVLLPPVTNVSTLHSMLCKSATSILMNQFPVDPLFIEMGLKQKPLCRFKEIEKDGVHMVFDVAHNEDSISYLLHQLKTTFPLERFRLVIGFSEGRDSSLFIKMLLSLTSHIHLIDCNHHKLIKKKEMLNKLSHSIKNNISYSNDDIAEIIKAVHLAQNNKEILVFTGTFYIFSFIYHILELDVEADFCSGSLSIIN